jgi:hypothetical protein
MKQTDEAQLAAPGAGVPWWQKLAGQYLLLPYYRVRLDDAQRLLLLDWANQRAQADREPPRLRPDP